MAIDGINFMETPASMLIKNIMSTYPGETSDSSTITCLR